jgi:hypothetical protein
MSCPREPEVVAAVLRHGMASVQLDAHLEQCTDCRDVAAITAVMRDDRDAMRTDVAVPAAGQIWWRAAIRARLEGTQAAARPLTWAHGAAAAVAAGLVAGTGGVAWSAIERVFVWMASRLADLTPAAPAMPDLLALGLTRGMLYAGVLAFVVLMPLVLYFALADD